MRGHHVYRRTAGGDRKQRIVDKYGDISQWDVSNVTNMESMFSSARSFNHRWFITDLAYVTEQHIDGYSYRMKNVKHSRWDDESAKSWTTRLERQLPSPPKHVLIISYPGLTGEQIQEMCKGILDTNKVKGSV